MVRQLSPYEQTHLARYGKADIDISEYGEMPVEYITGKVEFCGRVFEVTQDTLIPRIETEELIKLAINEVRNDLSTSFKMTKKEETKETIVIADVGTGCGAIGITLHLELNKLGIKNEVYLSEVSEKAVEVAKRNVDKVLSGLGAKEKKISETISQWDHIVTLQSDLMASFPLNQKFDLMVANLPYIPEQRIAYLDSSVKDFEPYVALDGGPEGLTLIQKFLEQAPTYLKPTGKIILEVDHTHTTQELSSKNQEVRIVTKTDSFGQQRFAIIEVADS